MWGREGGQVRLEERKSQLVDLFSSKMLCIVKHSSTYLLQVISEGGFSFVENPS